jgi:hypothetical protein
VYREIVGVPIYLKKGDVYLSLSVVRLGLRMGLQALLAGVDCEEGY